MCTLSIGLHNIYTFFVHSERKPQKWTSFCSSSSASSLSCSPQNTDDAGLLSLDDSSFSSPLDELDGLSVLSGDNGLLYVFDTRPEQVTKGAERNIVHSSQQSVSSSCRDDMEGIPLCPLLNVIELPTDVSRLVSCKHECILIKCYVCIIIVEVYSSDIRLSR